MLNEPVPLDVVMILAVLEPILLAATRSPFPDRMTCPATLFTILPFRMLPVADVRKATASAPDEIDLSERSPETSVM